MVAIQTNIPLQLQRYNTQLVTVSNLQIALFSSRTIADKSTTPHAKIKRTIEKLISNKQILEFSSAKSGTSNNIALYKVAYYSSRGKTYLEYELNHKALDLFIQSMNGAKGVHARNAFIDFTEHALQVANQINYEKTIPYIETRSETVELAKEFNEAVFNVHALAKTQGTHSSVDKFEMTYNKLIKKLIIGSEVKGSWRDHTDNVELPLLHLLLRTAIATINHHLRFNDPYKEIYQSVKSALNEVTTGGDYE